MNEDEYKKRRAERIDDLEELFVEFREQTADMDPSAISEVNDMLRDILNVLE